jgi:hypothetical protein
MVRWDAEPFWQWWQAQMEAREPEPSAGPSSPSSPSSPPARRAIPRDRRQLRGVDVVKGIMAQYSRAHYRAKHRR